MQALLTFRTHFGTHRRKRDLADTKCWSLQCLLMGTSSRTDQAAPELIASGREPGHRSVVTLELTATGQHLVRQAAAGREQELRRILRRLPPANRWPATTALHQLVEVASEGYGMISPTLVLM